MGCANTKEKLQSQMMILKIQRAEISKEREEKLKIYEEMTGERLYRKPIPEYYIVEQKTETSSNHYNNNSRKNSSKKLLFKVQIREKVQNQNILIPI